LTTGKYNLQILLSLSILCHSGRADILWWPSSEALSFGGIDYGKELTHIFVYYRRLPVQVDANYKSVFPDMAAIIPHVSGGFLQTAQIWANAGV